MRKIIINVIIIINNNLLLLLLAVVVVVFFIISFLDILIYLSPKWDAKWLNWICMYLLFIIYLSNEKLNDITCFAFIYLFLFVFCFVSAVSLRPHLNCRSWWPIPICWL